jgi:folate-binding protein YgfZ
MLVKLSHFGILSVSGMDAKKLLQGQLTCHLDEVVENKGAYGALCDPKGRVISFFYLSIWNNQYFLVMPFAMVGITLSSLKKYAPFYKVELKDVSATFYLYGSMTKIQPAAVLLTIPWGSSREIWMTDSNQFASTNLDQIWKYHDIQERLPAVYPETTGIFLPHDLDLPKLGAVSFNKGCYTGQEIIARMHYRGKLKHHLSGGEAQSTHPILPGQLVYENDKPVGTIVDACEYNHIYYILVVINQEPSENQLLFLPEQQTTITIKK